MSVEDVEYFDHDGFKLAFRQNGDGDPILLIHGFASSSLINWYSPGWFRTLNEAGYRVIAIDNRGHGLSDKSHDPSVYLPEFMANDALALLNYLGINKSHVMGYSMGARISAFMCLHSPSLVKNVIFGGLGIGMVTGAGHWEPVAKALLAENIETIDDPRGLMFRKFADRTKSDKQALAACVITSKKELTAEQVHSIKQPALVAVGSLDEISGEAEPLTALLPHGETLVIPNRDHMLAVGDPIYKKGVIEFLSKHPL
ncbi:alpha/beta fold hydrolase [Bartonella tamiae]|uniref:AB hydrolase-1 domain-containing protein n=1 Tax=Bartonella tamiae Th239 TaxID=1094558 RepID=J0QSC1_9HYPH|nr:alpha/beta hydrolase [Bartonella tamiae]EJF88766.1 hypothetical protein ME5_01317 [Bartonella tamiae Th239]EJF94984.1 hypothetical protein MEG_00565 [Bartonella tamiae Th307]